MNSAEFGENHEFLGSFGADLLRLDSVSSQTIESYMNLVFARLTAAGRIYDFMCSSAELIDPPNQRAAVAFISGSALAMRLAQVGFNTLNLDKLTEVAFTNVEVPEDASTDATYSNLIHSVACRGYVDAESFHELLNDWIDVICPDNAQQANARLGFGFGYYLIEDYLERRAFSDLETIVELYDEGYEVDWDLELKQLSNDESS